MAQTFEDVWRRCKLEMPAVPPLLIRTWAQDAYAKLCDSWGFGWLRKEGTLVTLASRSLTVTFSNGSTSVTSAALFVASDAGRQIRVDRLPIYTIISVTDASTVVLDRAFTETGGAQTATILDAYTTLPSDFARFLVVYDRYYQRIIPFWLSEDQIAVADPGNQVTDTGPRYLIAQRYSPATATLGQVRFQYWPSPTAAKTYPYLYIRSAEQLADADPLPGVLAERNDVLRTYVLSRGAMWRGTTDNPNPFFSPPTAQLLQQEWERELQKLSLTDDDQYPQQVWQVDWAKRFNDVVGPAKLLRQTDATVADYY